MREKINLLKESLCHGFTLMLRKKDHFTAKFFRNSIVRGQLCLKLWLGIDRPLLILIKLSSICRLSQYNIWEKGNIMCSGWTGWTQSKSTTKIMICSLITVILVLPFSSQSIKESYQHHSVLVMKSKESNCNFLKGIFGFSTISIRIAIKTISFHQGN